MEVLGLARDYLLQYSYWGVVILILAFSFLLPLSKTLVIVGAGALAAEGYGNVYLYLLISLIAILFADSVYYFLGRGLGIRVLQTRLFRRYNHRFLIAGQRFHQHAWLTVCMSRFMPYIRVFIYMVAGMQRMALPAFVSANFVSTFFYVLASISLGYVLAENRQRLVDMVRQGEFYAALVAVVLLAIYIGYRRRLNRHKLSPSQD